MPVDPSVKLKFEEIWKKGAFNQKYSQLWFSYEMTILIQIGWDNHIQSHIVSQDVPKDEANFFISLFLWNLLRVCVNPVPNSTHHFNQLWFIIEFKWREFILSKFVRLNKSHAHIVDGQLESNKNVRNANWTHFDEQRSRRGTKEPHKWTTNWYIVINLVDF